MRRANVPAVCWTSPLIRLNVWFLSRRGAVARLLAANWSYGAFTRGTLESGLLRGQGRKDVQLERNNRMTLKKRFAIKTFATREPNRTC